MNTRTLGFTLLSWCSIGLATSVPSQAQDANQLVTLDSYHPFRVVELDQWEQRRHAISRRVQLAAGLWPLPEKTPLNAQRFGPVQGDGFIVERVYFESFPGHFVTGSLFLPDGDSLAHGEVDGKRPAVLFPYGHWDQGRFHLNSKAATLNELASGAERFENAAINPIIPLGVQMARMGCIAFVHDMLGYADSQQLPDHRRGPRPHMNSSKAGEWGFVSPQATLHLQTNFGLQTWNSIRALDFVRGLDEVDPSRILATGASGGATQTMMLTAISDQITGAFPCVMVSTAMQGGCTCENSHYLRIGQGNVDIAAATAPRPLGLTTADDWTIEFETKGHPDLKRLYASLNVPDNYEAHFHNHFKHNYNHVNRTHFYHFANRHLKLGFTSPVLERDFAFLDKEKLTVWMPDRAKPSHYQSGDVHEKAVNHHWAKDSAQQWQRLVTQAREGDTSEITTWLLPAWQTMLHTDAVPQSPGNFKLEKRVEETAAMRLTGRLTHSAEGIPLLVHAAHPVNWDGSLLIDLQADPTAPSLAKHVTHAVAVPVLLGQDTGTSPNQATTYSGKEDMAADSWQRSPVYYYGYNDPAFVKRVHQVANLITSIRANSEWKVRKIVLQGEGPWAAIALATRLMPGCGDVELNLRASEFRFSQVSDHWDEHMLPGAAKYGDLAGLALADLALNGTASMTADESIDELIKAVNMKQQR